MRNIDHNQRYLNYLSHHAQQSQRTDFRDELAVSFIGVFHNVLKLNFQRSRHIWYSIHDQGLPPLTKLRNDSRRSP
jgi:hypothetical protein